VNDKLERIWKEVVTN